jgi:5-(carboxyamino)imidazole ribonucleotide mutase
VKPLVGVIMGSDYDLAVMKQAGEFLNQMKVSHETTIVSAHRTSERMISYAKSARKRGLHVIIAGAGGAAHLPGMISSMTSLPVIGVPIKTASLDGLDSLLSIVQMPPGVPVGTVAIDGAKNAAILACEILALKYPEVDNMIQQYKMSLKKDVLRKAILFERLGPQEYFSSSWKKR